MTQHFIGYQSAPRSESPATRPTAPSPFDSVSSAAVIADFARRLTDLEKAVKLQVPSDRITSMIALTKDTVLIQSDKIGMVGEVTFADWHRDVTGQATGTIDPSITQIRGGTIRTGKVASLSGNAYIDLDAGDTSPFLYASTGVALYGNGTFRLGPTGSKNLIWDGSNLSVDGAALLGSTAVSTVVSGAAMGAAYPGDFTSTILSNSGTAITITSSQLFRSGSGYAGVFIGAGGIYGKDASNNTTFSIDGSTGAATFAGNVNTGGYVYATGGITSGGFNGTLFANTGTADYNGIIALLNNTRVGLYVNQSGNGAGSIFYTTGSGTAMQGWSGNSSGIGVQAVNNSGGTALSVSGAMTKSGTELVTNLNADMIDNVHLSGLVQLNQVNVQFSTDNGATWNPVRFKP